MNIDTLLKNIDEFLDQNTPNYLYNSKFIPGKSHVLYSGPYWDNTEILDAIKVFLTGKWLVAGENVHKFEKEFARMFNVQHSHMVNSGSSANLVMITALKKYFQWSDNSEIIVSPAGFPTTISSILQNNLKPVFIDIEWDTLNFDITQIEKKITPNTKAILVSPVLGNPPDMDKLKEICDRYNLQLVGDSCDTLGTKWNNEDINRYYVAWSCSFYPAHHITTGEGGMCSTNIEELKKLFVSISWWGRDCYCVGSANLLPCGTCGKRFDRWLNNYDGVVDHKYIFTNIGYNLKPLDLQGALGLAQLKKFDIIDAKRKKSKNTIERIVTTYVHGVRGVTHLDKSETCWFGTPFVCESKELKNRLVSFCEENKIQTRNYFAGNILLHPAYEHLDDITQYPNANQVLDKVFFLGASPHYNDDVFNYVSQVFNEKWIN